MAYTTNSISAGIADLVDYFKTAVPCQPTGESGLPSTPVIPGPPRASEVVDGQGTGASEDTTREDGNLRTADAPTPEESESSAKPSSFVSTRFVGCFVTLGFLLSMM